MRTRREFPNAPASVVQARRFVASLLADLPGEQLDAALLMVSELVTNSLRHADAKFAVTVDRSAAQVDIAVSDTGPGDPVMREPAPTEPSGRGLRIVDSFADEWGVTMSGDREKSVWFRMRAEAITTNARSESAELASTTGLTASADAPDRPDTTTMFSRSARRGSPWSARSLSLRWSGCPS